MPGPASAGLFIYARNLEAIAHFYEALLGMARLHASDQIVVLQAQDVQLIVHQVPAPIAAGIVIESPPRPRDDAALKFFFTVPSLAQARSLAPSLGGSVMEPTYPGPGFTACNVVDPEGNIFHVRERAAASAFPSEPR
jgi:predicted enzyme related to lactoylglutathione lyase